MFHNIFAICFLKINLQSNKLLTAGSKLIKKRHALFIYLFLEKVSLNILRKSLKFKCTAFKIIFKFLFNFFASKTRSKNIK